MLYLVMFSLFTIFFLLSADIVYSSVLVLLLLLVAYVYFFKMISVSSMMSGANQIYPFFSDYVCVLLVSLSLLVVLFSLMAGLSHISIKKFSLYFLLLVVILSVLCLFFSVWNLLVFFLLFEFVLLPMMMIIVLWSSQSERLMANYYFFMYTIIGSFPLMLLVISATMKSNTNYLFFGLSLETPASWLFLFSFLFAFFCKLPIYGLHIWLPKAHVEAPVGGSMVLASLLLKMSGYSVLRLLSILISVSTLFFKFFTAFLLIGMLYPLVICYRQSDIKSLVAYSSVSHMCAAVLGLFLYSVYGFKGAFIVFLSHSLISPAMFFMSNMIYERLGSRMLMSMSGFENLTKSFAFFFVIFLIANMSYPPFISFFSELCIYLSLVSLSFYLSLFIFLFVLVSSVVMFYFIAKLMKSGANQIYLLVINKREQFVLFSLFSWLAAMTLLLTCL